MSKQGALLEKRALKFATEAHIHQVRKYTYEPYIVHPIAVAKLVQSVCHTPEMIAAAYLHDVVEDCGVKLELLHQMFGKQVSELVYWLTDQSKPEDGNRTARKEVDRKHIADAPAAAQTIKLADLIDNTSSITKHDPDFAVTYMREKDLLMSVLISGEPILYHQATKLLKLYHKGSSQ